MNANLIHHIAATIRRTESAVIEPAALAEVIVDDLPRFDTNARIIAAAVDALVDEGWEETDEGPHGVGTLSRDDLANIAQIVFRSLTESES